MKILYITTVGSTMNFFKNFIKELLQAGHTVDIATNINEREVPAYYSEWNCRIYALSCARSPISKGNISAISQIRDIVEKNHYDIVHCHTPIAAACTRLACRKLRKKQGVKVFYTAHGFHFYKGAPLKNWLIYYPIEKLCAHYTDKLITINSEDFNLAKRKLKAREVFYVHGVGIDLSKFSDTKTNNEAKRQELGIPKDIFLLLSVGELNANKNHQVIIRALAELNDPKIHYAIAGDGDKKEYLLGLANELGVSGQFHLLGRRDDIAALDSTADLFCFPSIREGLGLSPIEAMACGTPVVAAENRGTKSYITNGENGFLCKHDSAHEFVCAIRKLMCDDELRSEFVKKSKKVIEDYSASAVLSEMLNVYGKENFNIHQPIN